MSHRQKRRRTEGADEHHEPHWLAYNRSDEELGPIQSLRVEAHEADLIFDKEDVAVTIEAPGPDAQLSASKMVPGVPGSGLIRWDGGGTDDIWVDRFDARLLLSDLPEICTVQQTEPGSPVSSSGWSDLPSDNEDAFFLAPSEVEDIRYEKRRRMLEDARTERLAALRAAGDDAATPGEEDPWGGSDEEPDAVQMLLMERTAAHLQSSPDRTRLAARILANHGADKRFAFMRGRWRRAWIRAQAKAAVAATATAAAEPESEAKKKETKEAGLLGLASYGDSDDEGEVGKASETPKKDETNNETAKMEARRARAREWAAKRRTGKEASGGALVL